MRPPPARTRMANSLAPGLLPVRRRNGTKSAAQFGDLLRTRSGACPCGSCRVMARPKGEAGGIGGFRSDRPRCDVGAACGTDIVKDVLHAIRTSGAVIGADAGRGGAGRQVAVAPLALRSGFRHGTVLMSQALREPPCRGQAQGPRRGRWRSRSGPERSTQGWI